jgi:CDP-L-myo-inositol myo-inositolphosphotransferase
MRLRAIVTFRPGWDPGERLAGLSVAVRAAAEAAAAGAGEIWVVVGSPDGSGEIAEELERACSGIPGRVLPEDDVRERLALEPAQATIILHCGPYIIRAPRLRAFASGGSARLICDGHIVAERSGSGIEVADPDDVFDLDRPTSAQRAILAGTTKPSDGIVSRHLNRPVSQRVSALLLRIPSLRPWHITVATAAVALLMFFVLVNGGPAGLVAGGLLFHVASVVDGIDGEVARATYRTSASGAAMDSSVDMATNLLFYVGISVALARLHGGTELLVGAWCVTCALIGLSMIRYLAARAGDPGSFDIVKVHYRARYPDGVPARIVAWLVAITSRDFFALGNALIIASGWAVAVPWLLAGFATLWLALIAIATPSILRGANVARRPLDFAAEPRRALTDV